jgi:hypothetical protein
MSLSTDRQTEFPPPSGPAGAAAVQERLGGGCGEASTGRSRQGARPFYALLCRLRGQAGLPGEPRGEVVPRPRSMVTVDRLAGCVR